MSATIEHDGIVSRVDDRYVYVRIEQLSACASCHAKGVCTSSESEDKVIEALSMGQSYRVGDRVTVVGQKSLGMRAVFLAYVVPFFIVIALLSLLTALHCSEMMAGTLSLCALIPYFIFLRIIRKQLEAKFRFYVVKK